MATFTFNGKPVRTPAGKAGISVFLILVPALILGSVVMFFVSLWSHNVPALVGLVAVWLVLRLLNLRKKPIQFRFTLGSIVRFASMMVFLAGIWEHNPWMIVLGLIFSIKITFSK